MPLVRPNYSESGIIKDAIVPGRYVVKVMEAKESDKLDKNGNNALVVKFEVVKNSNPHLNGKRISRWFSLGGQGAKILYRFLKCVNPSYKGQDFTTESLLGGLIEVDVKIETNPNDRKEYAKIDRIYQYMEAGSVSDTFKGNVSDEKVPDFDDFDA